MRFIDKMDINILPEIHQEFELGDLTIFIGRSNCGKSRILEKIFSNVNNFYNNFQNIKDLQDPLKEIHKVYGISMLKVRSVSATYLKSYRQQKSSMLGLSRSVARCAESANIIDPTITDLGTDIIARGNNRRPLMEQGSGLHNMAHIFETLNAVADIILIDEPEVSQFPYGKIEILRAMIEKAEEKQIIVATHDPTLINQYLIKKLNGEKELKVVIYSFCGTKFEKIDLSNHDPETHVGYLSQTYSGKAVHLIVEGQTDFYAFQALLFRYAQFLKIPYYPKFVNKIAISYMAGEQWKVNKHHLPDPRYYNVLIVLDGEYKDDSQNDIQNNAWMKINKISSLSECKEGYVNLICLDAAKIEDAFNGVFDPVSNDKPTGLSLQIWQMSDEQIKRALEQNKPAQQIFSIVKWCLKEAGASMI